MCVSIHVLLSRYESGQISRRKLLGSLSALLVAPPLLAQSTPAIGATKHLNHVTLFVSDVQKSRAFYQSLFGMPVLTAQSAGVNLRVGNGFLGLYPPEGRPIGINHFCMTLDNFDPDSVLSKLTSLGVKGAIRLRGETKELYFEDPDGIRVQLQDISYNGGGGVLGNRLLT